jgi:hypothetical protein
MFRWLVLSMVLCVACSLNAADTKAKSTAKNKKAIPVADGGPRDYTSRNFLLHTDLSPDEAKELLQRLETMIAQVGKYWGKANGQTIEMYVAKDINSWPTGFFPPAAVDSLTTGGGLTISQTRAMVNSLTGKKIANVAAKSVVYAVADRGTPQHEAVHAYCHQTFGTTGPTWFAEGIAEIGQYWKDKDYSVQIHPEVLKYLQASEPKALADIVDSRERTGDSWQNYAWRWALCHMLAYNPNYGERFRPLGLQILAEQPGATFQAVYGPMAPEIAFEYRFFLDHMDNGFRVDLCRWDWKTKAVGLRGSANVQSKIEAGKGWQSSRLLAKEGQSYEITATGEWSLEKDGEKLTADGDANGKGKLVGVLFDDYKLSEPFALGSTARWAAPSDGVLFVRCEDEWNAIADNTGTITVKIKAAE